MPNQEGPALTLDRALWYGRTYRAHSASTAAETSPQFLKRLQKSQTKKSPTFLCLRTGGLIQDVSWEEDSALLGEFSTRSFLEYHNGGVESRLSQIMQGGAAPEILFERESVSGHSEPCEAERKGTAGDAADSTGTASVYPEVSRTLSARHDSSPCIDRGQEFCCYPETFQTLTANNAGWRQRMPDKANLSVICVKDEPK